MALEAEIKEERNMLEFDRRKLYYRETRRTQSYETKKHNMEPLLSSHHFIQTLHNPNPPTTLR